MIESFHRLSQKANSKREAKHRALASCNLLGTIKESQQVMNLEILGGFAHMLLFLSLKNRNMNKT